MSSDLQNPDPATLNQRQNRLQTIAVAVLFSVFVAGAWWFMSDSGQHSDDAMPDTVVNDLSTRNDDLAPAPQVTVWTSQSNEVLAAIDRVGAKHPGRTAELRERLAVISEFIKEYEQSLPHEFDRESEVGKELTQLHWEATNLQLDGTDESTNESSAVAVLARLDDEVLAQAELREQDIKQQVQSVVAPHLEIARRERDEIQRVTRDLEDEIASLEKSGKRIVDERERSIDQAARKQALDRDLPEIRRLLSPFISPGYTQPNKSAIDWPTTTEKAPVSLSGLERVGALQQTMKGLQNLMNCGLKASGSSQERPFGSFPGDDNRLTLPKTIAVLKRAQALLRIHGRALVEERLLSP